MKLKRIVAALLCAVTLVCSLSLGLIGSALIICETQYNYESVNMSWLKDLAVKENMTSIDGLAQSTEFTAVAKYPYRATAASFKEEVANYKLLYTLDSSMVDAAYLYMLSLAEQFASAAVSGYTDEYIRSYLESQGIVYPSGSDTDMAQARIVARAFFAILNSQEGYTVKKGTGLYEAFTAYVSSVMGVPLDSILKFDSSGSLSGLEEYVMAACKLALYNSGYDVTKDTPDEEVYRLIAVMTIRAQGISIDSQTATFEEIRDKYLCAMLCSIYGVSVDYASFKSASGGNLELFILKAIGRENGVAVKDSLSYEEAFDVICEQTDFFDLEPGEFYADIFEYNVPLKYKRETIWLYPQTLGTTDESEGKKVTVKIDGKTVRENYYVDVALDSDKPSQSVMIEVEYTDSSGTKSSSYKLNIIQGTESPVSGSVISQALSGVSGIVGELIDKVGADSTLADLFADVPFEIPERLLSSGLLFPEFDSDSIGSSFLALLLGYTSNDGSDLDTGTIGGTGVADEYNSSQNLSFNPDSLSGSLELDLQGLDSLPAQSVVIDTPEPQATPSVIQSQPSDWLSELLSDTKTLIVLGVMLAVTFAACFALFYQLLKASGRRKKRK